jgi:hypothetical protein
MMGEYGAAGVLLGGEGVHPSSKGARIDFTRGTARVIDGPFAQAKEVIAGFAIVDVRDRDEAIEIARKFAAASGTQVARCSSHLAISRHRTQCISERCRA